MKTTLIRIALAVAAVTALGLTACSAGAESKPAGNTQAVSTPQAANSNPPSAGNVATASNGGDVNITASADGSGGKTGSGDEGDSDDKPCVGNPNVSSSNGAVTLSGHCDTINITGSGNTVTFESADKVIISGGNNTVNGQELDDVEITSSGNTVTAADDLDEVTVSGSGNTISSQGVEKKNDTGSGNTIS